MDSLYRPLFVDTNLDTRRSLSRLQIVSTMIDLVKSGKMEALSVVLFEVVHYVSAKDKALIERASGGRVEKVWVK